MENEFIGAIESAINNVPRNQVLAEKFLSSRTDIKRYVVGKNEESAFLIKVIKIDGVIDDFEEKQSIWGRVPIVKSINIPSNSIVVNCSTSISPITVKKNLLANGVKNLINLNELLYAAQEKIPLPWFVEQMRKNYQFNSQEWIKLYHLMSDEESKNTLKKILSFRLTADISYMNEFSVRLNQQYFEDFMNYDSETFVDIGGFDGDTTEEFCKRYPNYNKVFLFEPSEENMLAAQKRLEEFKNIEYFNLGLSDKKGKLLFNPDAGSASTVTEKGMVSIEVTTLDNVIEEPVTLIKMDVEGWELKALVGCKRHIVNDKPKLAIAVYHNAQDFYEIPNYILSLNPDYDLYLRHYTEGWSESVMYFLPKSK